MMQRWTIFTLLVGMWIGLPSVRAAEDESVTRRFPVPGHGELELVIPKSWHVSVEQGPPGLKLPPTIDIQSDAGQKFDVKITPLPPPKGRKDWTSDANLKRTVQSRGRNDLRSAREKALDVKDLKGTQAAGYYYTLTDRNPDPGDFKYMTSVTLGLNEVLLTATVLDNDPAKPERARALEMLKAATLVGGAVAGGATTQSTQPATTQAALLHFTAPSGKWQVVMDKQSFESVDEQPHDGAKAKEFSAEGKDGWMLSVFFEPAAKPGDAKIARAFYLDRMKKSPVHMDKLKLSGDGNAAKMEYMVSDIQQKHANLYLVHDGVWVDVHISKMDFTSADQAALDALCRSVRIEVLK